MATATKDDQADRIVYTGTGDLAGWTYTIMKTSDGSVSVTETYNATLANGATWQTVQTQVEAGLVLG